MRYDATAEPFDPFSLLDDISHIELLELGLRKRQYICLAEFLIVIINFGPSAGFEGEQFFIFQPSISEGLSSPH